jgi:hypothetical protein
MKILDFNSFLNEMILSNHWIERTSERGESGKNWDWKTSSRILPITQSEYGWDIASLKDSSGEISKSNFFKFINHSKESILSLISGCLREMTRSSKFLSYNPPEGKKYIFTNLGSVHLWNGSTEAKITFSVKEGDFKGDNIYGISAWIPEKSDYKAITFLFQDSSESGKQEFLDNVYKYLEKIKKLPKDFLENYDFKYPYGKDFKCVIDLTEQNSKKIESQIRSQIEGYNLELDKEEGSYSELETSDSGRFTISEGRNISIKIPYIDPNEFTEVEIKGIVNMGEIKIASAGLNYKSITDVKIAFSPAHEKFKKIKDGKEIYGVYSLKEGTEFLNHRKKLMKVESRNKSIISQTPKEINSGIVGIFVKKY